MVDIGSMRPKGDALEVIIRWPYIPASYGPEAVGKDHIICRANGTLSFSVEEGHVSPDGHYRFKNAGDPSSRREEVEKRGFTNGEDQHWNLVLRVRSAQPCLLGSYSQMR